jgi:hypothetical protein
MTGLSSFSVRTEIAQMSMNSIPIRFEDMEDMQLQLLFEESSFFNFERQAIRYCRWLLKLSVEQRKMHHQSLSRIAHAVRTAHGQTVDITPECGCLMCAQWHSAAVQELCRQAGEERARRESARKAPQPPKPTFLYLVLDETNGYIKIGLAKDPSARERTLQSEKPQVRIIFSAPADADMERELHEEYAKCRIRGEWFELSETQVGDIKKRVKTQPTLHQK